MEDNEKNNEGKSYGLNLTSEQDLWDRFFKHTVVGLKEYVDMRFSESDKAKDNALHSIEEARKEAQTAMEKRLEGMNEFRDQLRDQASRFITREEYTIGHKPLEDKIAGKVSCEEFTSFKTQTNSVIEDYKINKAVLATKASVNMIIVSWAFNLILLIATIVSLVLRVQGK